jgi:anti-anti-sigma regulatory factor
MTPLPSWVECRPDQSGYARVVFHCRALTFEQAPYLSEAMYEQIVATGSHSALIDLSGVEYLSSDVLSGLLHLSRLLRDKGGRLLLCRLGPHMPMIFTPFPERQKAEPNRLSAFLFLED